MMLHYELIVLACGLGQARIDLKRRDALLGTLLVNQVDQLLFAGWIELVVGTGAPGGWLGRFRLGDRLGAYYLYAEIVQVVMSPGDNSASVGKQINQRHENRRGLR